MLTSYIHALSVLIFLQ